MTTHPTPVPALRSRPGLRSRLLATLLRALTDLPVTLAMLPMALVGAGRPAARMARRTAGNRSGEPAAESPGRPRTLLFALLMLLPAVLAFLDACDVVWVTGAGYLYPLRPDAFPAIGHPFTADHRFDGAWGGPTLVGAWLVHSAVALGLQAAGFPLMRLLASLRDRAARRLLIR